MTSCGTQWPCALRAPYKSLRRLLLFSLVFLMCSRDLEANWHPIWREGRRYVSLEDMANFYSLSLQPGNGRSFALISPNCALRGQRDSRELFINDVKYILCFPVRVEGSRFYLTSLDLLKIVEPVLRPQKIQNPKAVTTVVLDPGHGGYDSGANCLYGAEKGFTLDIVRRAARLLKERGYQVRLTRVSDTFVPLEKRAAIANHIPNSIFVSVHFNQSHSSVARGVETYCVAPLGVPSMDEEFVSNRDFKPCPGQQQDPQNIALATAIHTAVVRALDVPDRGIKRARYAVIRELHVPGVLVEGGFLSDAGDVRKIASPYYREQLANGIAQGVDHYRQAVKKRPSPPRISSSLPSFSLQDHHSLLRIIAPDLDPHLLGLLPSPAPKF